MTVRRLLDEADSRELTQWQAFVVAAARHEDDAIARRRAEHDITGE